MKKETVITILSVGVFSSFFLPVFEWNSFEMSGPNYILSTHIPFYKYFLLLIPFCASFLFCGSLNNGNYLFNKRFLLWIPLLSLLLISFMRYKNGDFENSFSDNGKDFSTIDIGFWLMLCLSFALILVRDRRKTYPEYQ